MPALLLAIGIGLVSGALSGAFGIGGGIITTPAIRLFMHAPALIAVGTPLPVIIPSAVTGAVTYLRGGQANLRAGLLLALPGAGMSVLGALAASRVGGSVVLVGTALLILWAAGDMLMQVLRPPVPQVSSLDERTFARAEAAAAGVEPPLARVEEAQEESGAPSATPCGGFDVPLGKVLSIGALAGLYSGFFGLGGGFVIVPMLTRWIRLPIKCAIGTSLVTVAALAVPGTVTHALLGNVDWRIAAGLAIGVVPGAAISARLTLGASERVIRIAFAALLLAVAVWLSISELPGVIGR